MSYTNLNNTSSYVITAATENFNSTATDHTVTNEAGQFIFYVAGATNTSTVTFDSTNGVIFNVPVVFTTKASISDTGSGDQKNIKIQGLVVFNKGVVFETNGRHNTTNANLSRFNLGDTLPLEITCKSTNASPASNFVPLNVNGYGLVNFNANSTISVYMQPYSVATIDQSSFRANIVQNAANVLNVYMDSQMVGVYVADMRQHIAYPDANPLTYTLHIIDDIDIQLARFPQNYQIRVTATNAVLNDIDFTDTVSAKIYIDEDAQLTFEDSAFSGASPLIQLTGTGSLRFGSDGTNTLTPNGQAGKLFDNDNITNNADNVQVTIFKSSSTNVVLPAVYDFPEPVTHYEGFNFIIKNTSTYNFPEFLHETLYVLVEGTTYGLTTYTPTISIVANFGVSIDVDTGSTLNIDNSFIYGVSGSNNSYALRKSGSGTLTFTNNGGTDATINRLFITTGTYFINDTNLNGSSTYTNIGEANIKFYLLDESGGTGSTYTFNNTNYNKNALYYVASRGVYLGTNNGIYTLNCNFLIEKNVNTLSLRTASGTGLVINNDTTGDYAIADGVTIKGTVGNSSPTDDTSGRLVINTTNTLNKPVITLTNMNLYDNDYLPSPLVLGADANVTCSTGVVFNMNSTQALRYPYNKKTITSISNAFIILGAIKTNKTYNLNSTLPDATPADGNTYNNNPWYASSLKFASGSTYKATNINKTGLVIYDTNSPILDLTSTRTFSIYHVANQTIELHSSSVLSNTDSNTTACLNLITNNLAMSIDVNDATFNVYGVSSITKTGSGTLTLSYGTNTLNYYNNDYNFTSLISTLGYANVLEYHNSINIYNGNYSFIDHDADTVVEDTVRLSIVTNDTVANPPTYTFTNTTNIKNGLTISHSTAGTVKFNGMTYSMTSEYDYLSILGTGAVELNNCSISATNAVTATSVIQLGGTNNVTIDNTTSGTLTHNGNSAYIYISGGQLTLSHATITNNGTGNMININNNGKLIMTSVTLTNNNGTNAMIYSTSSDNANTNLSLNTVTFNNNTDISMIQHLHNTNIDILGCTFNQLVARTGAIIELGSSVDTISGSLTIEPNATPTNSSFSTGVSGSYYFAIKAYTTGTINTTSTTMSASRTNVYWPNLGAIYNGTDKVPYVCDNGKGYVALSYDPTITVGFTHKNTSTGMYLTSTNSVVTNNYIYAAVGDTNTGALTSIVATLHCTQFTHLNGGSAITTNLDDIFTSDVFATGYAGRINNSHTQTFTISNTNRLARVTFSFTDSHSVYVGDLNIKIDFDSTINDFNYTIAETVTKPTFSLIDTNTLTVIDTKDTPRLVRISATKGYILPVYIIPQTSAIIDFFNFRNTDLDYKTYTVYSGYVNTANKTKLQSITSGTTSYDFYLKYVSSGIYYQPAEITASLKISLYSNNISTANPIVIETGPPVVDYLKIDIKNDTENYLFPIAYVVTRPEDITYSQSVTLYAEDSSNPNTGQIATLHRPSNVFSDFKIRYTFTLRFFMPLVTFDGDNHNILITGNTLGISNETYVFSALKDKDGNDITNVLTGGVLTTGLIDNGDNTCTIKYDGNDLTEKRITVTVDIGSLDNTQSGAIYFRKPNHQIQFKLKDLEPLKGFDSNNTIISVTSLEQTADSYFEFPGTVLITSALGNATYTSANTSPTIPITKGSSDTLTLQTAGIITANTPDLDVATQQLKVTLSMTTSKNSTNIMPYSFGDNKDYIIIGINSRSGSNTITFNENTKISGSASTYTVTLNADKYQTVPSIIYSDTSRTHIINHLFAIQPGTRSLTNTTYTSNNNIQIPTAFTASSVLDTDGINPNNTSPSIKPSTYNVSFPVGVITGTSSATRFIPYHKTTGANSSFKVEYELVGTNTTTNDVLTLTKGTDYDTFASDLTTPAEKFVTINSTNYAQNNYIYFTLKTQTYQWIDVYVYYTDATNTDMESVPAAATGTRQFLARYDFSLASKDDTKTLLVNMGAWSIKPNENGDLVFVYNGTINGQSQSIDAEKYGATSTFTLSAPTSVVHKTINIS